MWLKLIIVTGITSWMLIIINSRLNIMEKRFENF